MLRRLRAVPPPRRLCLRRLCVLPHQPALARHLEGMISRHAEIEAELADGTAAFSAERMRELSRLTPIVEAHAEALALTRELAELRSLASDSTAEAELREMAKSELGEGESSLSGVEEQLISLLVPPAEGDERGAVIEVRAGVGGLEAGLFAT
jgi:peptide chain release factor 1